ncbi:hypothetical protein G9A89_015000 [Geosiphon pyriformis]|nr:hypothetical protein G9A89_015000 [Geosiphon pyriformis]
MTGYSGEVELNGSNLVNQMDTIFQHGEFDTIANNFGELDSNSIKTLFDEWLANDLAGFISEADEDYTFLTTNQNTTISSDDVSPHLSSTLTTPSADLGFDFVTTPQETIESPLFGSSNASFPGSPLLNPVGAYYPSNFQDLNFTDIGFTDIDDPTFQSNLIKLPSSTAALNIPVSIPESTIVDTSESVSSSSSMSTNISDSISASDMETISQQQSQSNVTLPISGALNIPWDGNITNITEIKPRDDTASAFVDAILNLNAQTSRRSRSTSKTANPGHSATPHITSRHMIPKNAVRSRRNPKVSRISTAIVPSQSAQSPNLITPPLSSPISNTIDADHTTLSTNTSIEEKASSTISIPNTVYSPKSIPTASTDVSAASNSTSYSAITISNTNRKYTTCPSNITPYATSITPSTSIPYSAASPAISDVSTTSTGSGASRNPRKRRSSEISRDSNEEIVLKRAKNTDAARRSRQRKVVRMENLEKEVNQLKAANAGLQTRVAVLESEKQGLEEKNAEREVRIRQLELQLSEAHQRLINKI